MRKAKSSRVVCANSENQRPGVWFLAALFQCGWKWHTRGLHYFELCSSTVTFVCARSEEQLSCRGKTERGGDLPMTSL